MSGCRRSGFGRQRMSDYRRSARWLGPPLRPDPVAVSADQIALGNLAFDVLPAKALDSLSADALSSPPPDMVEVSTFHAACKGVAAILAPPALLCDCPLLLSSVSLANLERPASGTVPAGREAGDPRIVSSAADTIRSPRCCRLGTTGDTRTLFWCPLACSVFVSKWPWHRVSIIYYPAISTPGRALPGLP